LRAKYDAEARAAAARAHAPVPREQALTPTPPSKLLQRYLASEATRVPESTGAPSGAALEAEVRARTRALELEVARADGAASAHATYHGRRRVRCGAGGDARVTRGGDSDLDGAARGVDAAARAVRRARAASTRADKESDAGVSLEVLKLARDVAKHIEASSRVLQNATAVLARLDDGSAETAPAHARIAESDEDAWTDGSSGAVPLTPRSAAGAPRADSDAWTEGSDDDEPPPPTTPPPED